MKRVVGFISTLVVVLVVALAIALVGVRLLGLQTFVVLSGSMEPTFQTGSVVYVAPARAEDIASGDIITYRINADAMVTHRVQEVVADNGSIGFRTKGDANSVADSRLVSADQLVGKAIVSVPLLGYLVEFVHSSQGMAVLALVAVGLVILVALPGWLPDGKGNEACDEAGA